MSIESKMLLAATISKAAFLLDATIAHPCGGSVISVRKSPVWLHTTSPITTLQTRAIDRATGVSAKFSATTRLFSS